MKTTIQIRTADFEYVMQEFDKELTPQQAVEAFKDLQSAWKGGDGISEKDFQRAVDLYLSKQEGETETYMAMSLEQQKWFQITKRAFKRLSYDNASDTN